MQKSESFLLEDGESLLNVINRTFISTEFVKQILGVQLDPVTGENVLTLFLHELMLPVRSLLGGRQNDQKDENYPASNYVWCDTKVNLEDSKFVERAYFLGKFDTDYIIELGPRNGDVQRLDYSDYQDARPQVRNFSQIFCEIKRGEACPRVPNQEEQQKIESRLLVNGFDVSCYYLPEKDKQVFGGLSYDQKYNILSQACTYCILGRMRYFFIFTGNHITFGAIMFKEETEKEDDVLVKVTKSFDCSVIEDQGSGLSVWQMLVYFILAAHEDWLIGKIPDSLSLTEPIKGFVKPSARITFEGTYVQVPRVNSWSRLILTLRIPERVFQLQYYFLLLIFVSWML